jgi:hypothetical protein
MILKGELDADCVAVVSAHEGHVVVRSASRRAAPSPPASQSRGDISRASPNP